MNDLGVGVSLRRQHYSDLLNTAHSADWFELVSENYMNYGGRPRQVIEQLKARYPLICHGLGLSLGSGEGVAPDYCEALHELLEFTDSPWFSDHLCISSTLKHHYHDLLPVMKTQESLGIIVDKIKWVQDEFQRPFAIENISYYGESKYNTIGEADFINSILEQTKCYLLLDINNVYVNGQNLSMDPQFFLSQIPSERVIQIHLAGHLKRDDFVIDTHGAPVCDEVLELYEWYLKQLGRPVSTLIEWENNLPSFLELDREVLKVKEVRERVFS